MELPAANRPANQVFVTPKWGDSASGACNPAMLSSRPTHTNSHARHFDSSTRVLASATATPAMSYASETMSMARLNSLTGNMLSQTNTCDTCHSPGGAVNGVSEARQKWASSNPVSCEAATTAHPAVLKVSLHLTSLEMATMMLITGHGRRAFSTLPVIRSQETASTSMALPTATR